jgi:hypothetical protein
MSPSLTTSFIPFRGMYPTITLSLQMIVDQEDPNISVLRILDQNVRIRGYAQQCLEWRFQPF